MILLSIVKKYIYNQNENKKYKETKIIIIKIHLAELLRTIMRHCNAMSCET
jgi:hypothetical protein